MRVVFVDPSRTTTKFVRRVLEARHDVKTFADGAEALAYIESDPEVGAVITSAEPLSISGYEVCWEARLLANSHRPIYVLMMSAGIGDKALMEALDSGADDFVGKPPVAGELYARLRAAERFTRMQRELIRLATTDTLTGLFNRRAFFERANALCARSVAGALSAIMMDIDHFKKINDTFGHEGGDEAVRAVARQVMAEKTVAGRLGGEEFALLLDGGSRHDAAVLAERLRTRIAACEIEIAGHTINLTCSFGVSEWCADDSIDTLLRRADMALYEAKSRGRNRVVAGDDGLTAPNYSTVGRPVRSAERRRA